LSDNKIDSDSLRIKIIESISKQKRKTVTVLSSLLAVQDSFHYIPDEAIEEIAKTCKVTINDVWSVASFYTNFRFTPPGEKTLDVCWGPSCHINGAQKLITQAHELLDIQGEGESEDNKVTLRYSTCLGACAQSPVFAIDHKMYGKLNKDKVNSIVNTLKNE
jgi:NADH:ubiquinone oxidoreductase subunit E